jgi:hypothetical protein
MKLASVLVPSLFACLAATPAQAQISSQCPDTRASNVPALIVYQGGYTRCGIGVQVLGLPISVGGSKCFRNEIIYPAHQECLGALGEGLECVPEASMPVQHNRCECTLVGVLGTGISLPKCSCSPAGTLGTLEDAQTVLCHGTE